MGLRARILRCTAPEIGPSRREALKGLCKTVREALTFDTTFARMLKDGAIRMYGKRRAARYGVPGWKPKKVKR